MATFVSSADLTLAVTAQDGNECVHVFAPGDPQDIPESHFRCLKAARAAPGLTEQA